MKKLLFICACALTLYSCDKTKQYNCYCDNGNTYYNEQATDEDAKVWCDTHDKPCELNDPNCLVEWDCSLQ